MVSRLTSSLECISSTFLSCLIGIHVRQLAHAAEVLFWVVDCAESTRMLVWRQSIDQFSLLLSFHLDCVLVLGGVPVKIVGPVGASPSITHVAKG